MNAICVHQYGEPEVLRLQSVSDLSTGLGQVLVEVRAAGVNPVDTYIRAGTYPVKKSLPFTPGSDAAGIVLEVGREVKDIRVKDRVFVCGSLSGTYAQQCLCEPSQLWQLPKGIDFPQGAALGIPYGTAWQALFGRAKAVSGQVVLVHGASGGVGIAATQLATAAGLTVIGTAGTDTGCQLVKEQGARWCLDHHSPNHFDTVLELTHGHGVDIILEMLANENLDRDLDILAPGGSVVVIGNRGQIKIDPRKTMARDLNILGMLLANMLPQEKAVMYNAIQTGLEAGDLKPVVAREWPLEDAAKAHHEIIEGAHFGKIVLIP